MFAEAKDRQSLMALLSEAGTKLSVKFGISLMLLLIPTVCMGATFPVMASILIRRQRDMGLRIGQLYSLNTAGAALGAASAGFLLIPAWGLDGAVYTACALNLAVVVLALRLNKRIRMRFSFIVN